MAHRNTAVGKTVTTNAVRAALVRRGVHLELFTIVWMVAEAVVSIAAGVLARSALLTAFGIDSMVELLTGASLLWRLLVEARGGNIERVERAEQRTALVVGIALALLCVYVLVTAVYGLATHMRPKPSPLGIGITALAVVVMPWLAYTKRRIAGRIDSGALRGDAASSLTCGYMAATVLVGLALDATLHWWWIENVAELVFLVWLAQEAREALEEARKD
jgi:divalent metal cation (Fe/Co/Zn/Cd) transporter